MDHPQTLRAFSHELAKIAGEEKAKDAAKFLGMRGRDAAFLAGGAVGAHLLRRAYKDWRMGRELRRQQGGQGY